VIIKVAKFLVMVTSEASMGSSPETRGFGRPRLEGRPLEGEMRNTVSKAIVAGLAAVTLAAATIGAVEPASAAGAVVWRGGGGGWHGGGWRGGYAPGWRGAAWGGGWRGGPGWNGARVWHPGYWNGGAWYGGWWGPAVAVGALAAGAIALGAATSPYAYGDPSVQVRPLYAPNGAWIGNGPVNVCQ
jgi:hypothetical protein